MAPAPPWMIMRGLMEPGGGEDEDILSGRCGQSLVWIGLGMDCYVLY